MTAKHVWLDIGCGVGIFLEIAATTGQRVVGVEPSAAAEALARSRTGGEVISGDFMTLDDLPKVGVVTIFDVVRHVVDPLAFLTRAYDRLVDGGWLVIRESNAQFGHNVRNRRRADADQVTVSEYVQEWTQRGIDATLRRVGFRQVEVRPSPIFFDGSDSAAVRIAKPTLGAIWNAWSTLTGRCIGPNFLVLARR